MRAGRGDRPALHPLHLRHDRPAEGRRARQWRPHGRAEMVDVGDLRHRPRRDLLGGLRRRLGGRPFLHRLRAAAARLHDASSTRASRSARPMPAPSGASSPSTRSRRSSPRRPPSAPSSSEDPDGELHRRNTTCRNSARCSSPASAPIPTTIEWAEQHLGVPVIDHWWQTETGWSICANPVGLGLLPVKYGSPGVPMPGYDLRVLDDAGHAGRRPARSATSS